MLDIAYYKHISLYKTIQQVGSDNSNEVHIQKQQKRNTEKLTSLPSENQLSKNSLVRTDNIQPHTSYISFLCAFAVEPRKIEDGDVDRTLRQGKRQLCNAQEKRKIKLKKSTGW